MSIASHQALVDMPIVKIRENFQITLPASVRKKFRMAVGDYVETENTEDGILIRPVKVIRSEDAWFYTKEWQKGEAETDQAIADGETTGPFDNIKDALKSLKTAKL